MKKRKRKKKSFIKIYGKDIFYSLMAVIGVVCSFFILDIYTRNLIYPTCSFYKVSSLSPNLFTLSFIFFIIGILVLLRKENRIKFYSITLTLSNILFCVQVMSFFKNQKVLNLKNIFFSLELFNPINLEIILVVLLSFGFMIVAIFYMNKISDYKRDSYYYIYTILLMIIFVGGSKGVATTLLGPEIISNSKTLYPKNVYLENKQTEENFEVSGFYEYYLNQTWKFLENRYYELEKEE